MGSTCVTSFASRLPRVVGRAKSFARHEVPIEPFLSFLLRSGTGLATAAAEFREARRWVRGHRQSYRRELKELVGLWGA